MTLRSWMGALALALLMGSLAEAKLDSKEWSELQKKAKAAVKARDTAGIASVIGQVAADDSKRAVEMIEDLALVPSAEIYNAARDALASFTDAEAVGEMCKQLNKGKWPFKVLLADAFARRSDDESIKALNENLDDKRPEVQRAVVDAITARRSKTSVDALVSVLEDLEKKGREGLNTEKVREALEAITGEKFDKAVDWRSWWDGNKDKFSVGERPTTGREKNEVGGTVLRRPKFFGSEIKSRRVVFVIDVSGSMSASDPVPPPSSGRGREETGGKKGDDKDEPVTTSRVRIDRAKFALEHALKNLPDDAYFSVMAYNGTLPAPGPEPILPKAKDYRWIEVWSPKLQKASDKAKASSIEFVQRFKAEGGTFTFNALRAALEITDADNIILLSDGAPGDFKPGTPGAAGPPAPGSTMTTDEILNEIKALNAFRKVRIDTFGFDMSAAMGGATMVGGDPYVEFLKKLAEQNSGKFTPIR